MKRFLLVVMLFASAASLYAAELKVTGDMEVRGLMDSNDGDSYSDRTTATWFDYDLTINGALVANENATVFTRLAFDKTVDDSGYVEDSNVAGDDYLAIERAYINYKFFPFLQLNTGLMGGGQWASTFGDDEANVMRVQAIGALSEDMIFILTYEKKDEEGIEYETEETTAYYASAKIKAAGITILPLLTYVDGPQQMGNDDYNVNVYAVNLGINGDFGMIGFESEFAYKMYDDGGLNDDNDAALDAAYASGIPANVAMAVAARTLDDVTYGAYVNVFVKLAEKTKVGVAVAYGSADEDNNYDEALCQYGFGPDFDFTLITGEADTYAYGTNVKLYAEAAVMEKLTVGVTAAYFMPTDDKVQGDYSAWEVDLTADYAFDAAATYSVGVGYMSETVDPAVGSEVTDTELFVMHKFAVKF